MTGKILESEETEREHLIGDAWRKEAAQGLTAEEISRSRQIHGSNVLTPPKRKPMWKLYLEKFQDPVVRVLLVAAVLSLGISVVENEYVETIGIFAAILLATGIGFLFEYDANRKFDLLNTVNDDNRVRVLREGAVQEVPRKEIVVGDLVLLETGEEIPADGQLLRAVGMQVNESALTGEPMAHKTADESRLDAEATYASNMLMRGTTVLDGHGMMRVTKVGDQTEIGHVAKQAVEQSEEPTPLNMQLERLAKYIGYVGFSVAALAFIVFFVKNVLLVYHFTELHTLSEWLPVINQTLQIFMMAVTLVVVAVPEGLPMSVTLSLALNMRRMLAANNLVRKMHACETIGAVNVICTDKTGTLTQNQMQVSHAHFTAITGDGQADRSVYAKLLYEGISVNTTAFLDMHGNRPTGIGNPTEVALLLWLHDQGIDYLSWRRKAQVVSQLAFSTERKLMATLVHSAEVEGKKVLYVKGAPEIVMHHCTSVATTQGLVPMERLADNFDSTLLDYQKQGQRTLGLAYRVMPDEEEETDCKALIDQGGLTFMGIVAISDPIRTDVPAAVKRCRDAGIEVKMVTGDTKITAIEIARQAGLWTDQEDDEKNCITGADFAALTDEEALDRVTDIRIMARARPADKQRFVRLLQKRGQVVAVTGDGTNDAPALNHAQVGLSMGSGTSVAKEASDITLLDDSFHSIGVAVMWGRSLYKNIQRFILFQLTINFVALLIMLVGAFGGTELPLTVTQMLWVNLIMDTFAAMALASIPPSEAVMNEPPRNRNDFIITRSMGIQILTYGIVFLLVLMGLLHYYNTLPGGINIERLTLFFTVFVMLQFWNIFNAKTFGTDESAFKDITGAKGLLLVAAMIFVGQILIVQFGGAVFRTVPLNTTQWLWIVGLTSLVFWLGEAVRLVKRLFKR